MAEKHSDNIEVSYVDNSNNEPFSYMYDLPETAVHLPDERDEIIVNNDMYLEVPLTNNTQSAPSEPSDQETKSMVPELKNTKHLQDFITNPKNKVEVFPLLLTVTGFPESGKTTAINESFYLPEGNEKQIFAHHELVASGIPIKKKIKPFAAKRDRSFKYGVQAGITKESAKISFGEPIQNNQRTFNDVHLRSHLLVMAKHIQERQELSLHKIKRKQNITEQLECELKNGIRLVNLWDVSINESIRPFLETISRCFTRNQMWLFIDLDKDVPELQLPLKTKDDTKLKMQWRSRMQYLLRMCQMCKHTKVSPKDGYRKFCTVFAIHKRPLQNASTTASTLIQNLKDELENAAKQMGVENIINLEIKTCLGKLNTRMFRKIMKTTLHHLDKEEIPLSWLFLRSSFIDHPTYYITIGELETKAKECKINIITSALTEFCDFFTSFGSIIDIRKICKDSKYIIVKPFAFLSRLQELYGEKVKKGLISTPQNEEEKVLMEILASVGITWFMEGPNKYYFPSLSDTGKIERQNIPWALQLVVSLQAPKMNLDVELPQKIHEKLSLCKETTYRAQFELTEYTNSVAITIQNDIKAKLMITFQGDITEITFEDKFIKKTQENKDAQMHIKKLCIEIIKAIQEMFQEKSESIRYNFAIICKADSHSKINVAFNTFRKRHILPKYSLCEKCTEDTLYSQNKHIIKAWSKALENNPIPDEMKLQGDFSLGDAETLATEISKYPWIAIDMFAKKLRAKTYLTKPEKKQEWVVMGMIMEWEGRRREDDESSKKAMAGMLMELHQEWTEKNKLPDGTQRPEFNNLARQLDFQALTKKQMEDIQRQIEEREKNAEAEH